AGDADMIETAKAILKRGDPVLIFPEGTRTRPGALGKPKRGVGRLALETGAPVVPIAVIGTEAIRRGWRIRPHKVSIRAGRALRFPQVENPSKALATAVTDRIWPCVMLQWEWLGGLPPLRRAAVIGAGAWGTALAVMLARAGVEVELACRTREQAEVLMRARANDHYLPGVMLPPGVSVTSANDVELATQDLVCLAVPASALPAALAANGGRVPARAGVLVTSKGLVPPLVTLPAAYVSERVHARAVACVGGPAHAPDALENGASLVVASLDGGFARQVSDTLASADFDVHRSTDVTGVELAGAAKNAAALAAAAAASAGPNIAGAAAGKVFAEVGAYARRRGAHAETLAGLAGTGDLVSSILYTGSRNRRAGELIASGVPAAQVVPRLGQLAEAIDAVPLLAGALREAGVPAPTVEGLADVIEGRLEPASWSQTITAPRPPARKVRAA
ncbi:MAG: glycerol-3-phosphate dehydrogenase, partial [Solirubrobacteraceae bacterium]|nr:glycerol-3-phosphate dehydrogenase [Solirubrobacteraceae bacterium]